MLHNTVSVQVVVEKMTLTKRAVSKFQECLLEAIKLVAKRVELSTVLEFAYVIASICSIS